MTTLKEKIEIMTAAEDGAEIQFSIRNTSVWGKAISPSWDWPGNDYRIKPQPRDIWVAKPAGDEGDSGDIYSKKPTLNTEFYSDWVITHYREVIK